MHTLESLMLLPVSGFISLSLSPPPLIESRLHIFHCINSLASHSCTVLNLPTTSIQPLLSVTIKLCTLVTHTYFLLETALTQHTL